MCYLNRMNGNTPLTPVGLDELYALLKKREFLKDHTARNEKAIHAFLYPSEALPQIQPWPTGLGDSR